MKFVQELFARNGVKYTKYFTYYDIDLYVDIITPNGDVNTVSTSNFKYMY